MRYASERIVAAMSPAYTGEGRTDAKDAHVFAETARIRTDLAVVDTDTDLVRSLAVCCPADTARTCRPTGSGGSTGCETC